MDKSYLERRRDLKLGIKQSTDPGAAKTQASPADLRKSDGTPAKQPGPPKSAKKGLAGKNRSNIKTANKKRQKQNRAYTKVKKKFLVENPTCQAQLEGCTGQATDLHHIGGRTGENLLKVEGFAALCRTCHDIIHKKMSAQQAKKIGMKK
jgi:hypothetical protein